MARIIVIDDDMAIGRLIQIILEGYGHEVLTTSNGTDGLSQCQTYAPELIITDILMPGIDGIEVIQKLHKDCPQVKIIAMSGGGVFLDAGQVLKIASRLIVGKVLSKPFTPEMLTHLVQQTLSERKIA